MKKTYLKTFTTILILILTLLYCLQFTSLYNKTNSNSNYLTVYFIDVETPTNNNFASLLFLRSSFMILNKNMWFFS